MDINDLYSYIRQNTTDDYDILKNKIDEFSHEGLEPIRTYNIISQYIALKPFCRALDVINGDYIEFIKAIKIATFLKAKFNNENAISVMQKTLVYEDNNVCIFKPTNFQESSIIGEPICCFAYSQGRWDEHYNAYEEAIYYVFDVMRENSIHDFVAITVRPNGRALVLDKNHNWWSPADSIRYIQGLGEGASTIVTKEGKSIKTENKQYNNMNKKLIRLTESDLHRIVKESVEKILRESEPDLYDTLARPNGELDMSNPYTWAKSPKMLKDMGYDENGMKNGKKYYDHLLNPNWRFNKRSAGTDFALNEPMGDQKSIRADIANMAKKQSDADARWQKAADSRPLHRKGSPNRGI